MSGAALWSLTITIVSFLVAIGVLVAVHEFGHFWVARRVGIRVLRFSIGFGKPLWRRVSPHDGVEYLISAIPLGGYVKLLDEREGNVAPADLPYAFNRQPVWKRIATLLAGPGANLIFAVLVYWLILVVGVPTLKPVIATVTPDSVAAHAGLYEQDLIVQVGTRTVTTREAAMLALFQEALTDRIRLRVKGSQGDERQVTLLPNTQGKTVEVETLLTELGFNFWAPKIPAVIGKILPGSAADQAGLQIDDEIVAVDGLAVADFAALVKLVSPRLDETVVFSIRRHSEALELPVHVAVEQHEGHRIGRIGVQPVVTQVTVPAELEIIDRYGPLPAVARAVQKTWDMSALTLQALWGIVVGKVAVNQLTGPITIAEVAGSAWRHGWLAFVSMLGIISISVGLLNLMPIPVLDGGQIMFQLAELAKGSPVSERTQKIGQQVGVAMLALLMGLAFYNDIVRQLS